MATSKASKDNTEPREDAPAGPQDEPDAGAVGGDDATKGEGVGEALGPDVDKSFPTVDFGDTPGSPGDPK